MVAFFIYRWFAMIDKAIPEQVEIGLSDRPHEAANPFPSFVLAAIPAGLVLTISWFGIFTFVNAYLTKELGFSNRAWTATTLWFSGGMIFWSIACPEISSLLGRRKTVFASMLLAAVFYLVMAVVKNQTVICMMMFWMGFVSAANNVAWLPIVAKVGRNRPGQALAVNQFLAVIVGAVLLISGGYLLANVSYRTGFLCFAGICGACALFFFAVSRTFETSQPVEIVSFRKFSRQDFARLASGPFIMLMIFGFCIEPFNYHTLNQLYPNLVHDHYNLGNQGIAAVVALGRLPALAVLLFLASRIDRRNILRLYASFLLLAGLVITVLGFQSTLSMTIALYLVFYIFHGGAWGTNTAAVYNVVDPRLSDAAFAVMSVLATLAVFLVGIVHNRLLVLGFSLPRVFVICGLTAIAGAMIQILYSFRKRSRS